MELFLLSYSCARRMRTTTTTTETDPPHSRSIPLSSLALILLASSFIITHATAKAALAGDEDSCGSQLLALSPCLPYVTAPPNNVSSQADPKCCDAFMAAARGGAGCLCQLLQDPSLLGFPINPTRLLSLPSFCRSGGGGSSSNLTSAGQLRRICRGKGGGGGGGGASQAIASAPSPSSLLETLPPSASSHQLSNINTPTSTSTSSSKSLLSPPPPAAYMPIVTAITFFTLTGLE